MIATALFAGIVAGVRAGGAVQAHAHSSRYVYVSTPMTHAEAAAYCADAFGSALARIDGPLANSEVRGLVESAAWIGKGVDGYTHFAGAAGESATEDACLRISADTGEWGATDCALSRHFVCNGVPIPIDSAPVSAEDISVEVKMTLAEAERFCEAMFGTGGGTDAPTQQPTGSPTSSPTPFPTPSPTASPTQSPSKDPSTSPTPAPTRSPTRSPTPLPTSSPTESPTDSPTTAAPTKAPTAGSTFEYPDTLQCKDATSNVPGNKVTLTGVPAYDVSVQFEMNGIPSENPTRVIYTIGDRRPTAYVHNGYIKFYFWADGVQTGVAIHIETSVEMGVWHELRFSVRRDAVNAGKDCASIYLNGGQVGNSFCNIVVDRPAETPVYLCGSTHYRGIAGTWVRDFKITPVVSRRAHAHAHAHTACAPACSFDFCASVPANTVCSASVDALVDPSGTADACGHVMCRDCSASTRGCVRACLARQNWFGDDLACQSVCAQGEAPQHRCFNNYS